jgi:hypothetical protein
MHFLLISATFNFLNLILWQRTKILVRKSRIKTGVDSNQVILVALNSVETSLLEERAWMRTFSRTYLLAEINNLAVRALNSLDVKDLSSLAVRALRKTWVWALSVEAKVALPAAATVVHQDWTATFSFDSGHLPGKKD